MRGEREGAGRGVGRAVTERDWAERGWAAERAQGKGRREWATGLMMDWAGLVGLGWVSFFSFLFATSLQFKPNKLIEFKLEFEFNPNTQTNKIMHQHECTNKFALK